MSWKKALEAAQKVSAKYAGKTDYVRWTAWKEDKTEISKWQNTACYATGMQILPELEIHCIPYGGPSKTQMPKVWYFHFFKLLKKAGIVPPEVKLLHQNGANCMIIPRTGWDRHTLYMTLCYYRMTDIKPGEAMQIMLLYKRLAAQGTTFLQCLHYMAMASAIGGGHLFMNKGTYGITVPIKDLANGQALAWWAGLSKEERREKCPPGVTGAYTNTFLGTKAKEMKSLEVSELGDILNPKHAPLYLGPIHTPATSGGPPEKP